MSGWSLFVIVDCAPAPDRFAELRHHAATAGLPCRSLFANQPESEHEAAAPWLIEMPQGAIHPATDLWLANLGRSPAGVTRLASAAPFEPLFQHLEAQLDIVLPDGSLALMRYYDPRAWMRYCEVLTVDQQLELLGPVLEWQVTLQGQSWTLMRSELLRLQKDAADAATDA